MENMQRRALELYHLFLLCEIWKANCTLIHWWHGCCYSSHKYVYELHSFEFLNSTLTLVSLRLLIGIRQVSLTLLIGIRLISFQQFVYTYRATEVSYAGKYDQWNDSNCLYKSEKYVQWQWSCFILERNGYAIIDGEGGYKEVLDEQGYQDN